MLTVNQLTFDYFDKPLLHDVSFTLNPGEGLWIKGENGRGKTTLLKLLASLLTPLSGEFTLPPLMYIGHLLALSPLLTVYETLYFDPMRTIPDGNISEILTTLNLNADLPCRLLSSGQKKRISLAKLLLSQTALWLLDEPFVALDEQGMAWLNGLIQQHLNQGGLVILTSHQPLSGLSLKEYTL